MKTIERAIFPLLKRALSDQRVVVITGMRRVGKTTSLQWLLNQVPSNNKLYMDLERLDQRAVFQEKNYDNVLNYFRNLGLNINEPMTVALDEIQNTPNLPSVVKYLYDHYRIKFLLTGSSSFYLKNFFSESMAGRKIVFEMFPLGFGEFLDFHGVPYHRRTVFDEMVFDAREFDRLSAYYDEFITFGGLPNVVLEPKAETKREILLDILSSYINIDVQVLADFRKINELKVLMNALSVRIGNKLDLTKLSQIAGISRPTLNEYLEFLEMTYIIYRLPAYSSPDKAAVLSRKLYFRDNGIATVLSNPGEGALFENAVFNQLYAYGNLAHLSKRNEYEVDFIITPPEELPVALEAKIHPTIKDDLKLKKIAQRNGFNKSWIVGKIPSPGFEKFIWGGSIL
jgi:hypothetical protein